MRAVVILAVAIAGCGRIDFDDRLADAIGPDDAADGNSADAPTNGLILHMPFDGTTEDIAGGRTPACAGCTVGFTAHPGFGQAGIFTGDPTCLAFPDEPELRPAEFTLAMWFRTDTTGFMSTFGKGFDAVATDDNSWEFWFDVNRTVHFSTVNGGTPFVTASPPTISVWHHVAGTFDGGTKRLYVDGVEQMSGAAIPTSYDADPLRIGCDHGSNILTHWFVGELDEIRIYKRVLTASEIATLAQ